MNLLNAFALWFKQLSSKQKLSLSLASAFIILLTVLLSYWILSPTYAVLFTQLDEQDANQIVNQLEGDNIAYQLRNDGRDVLIDKELIAKTRLKVMASGLNLSGRVGFELFDKNDFGMTDFSQKINYQRALQGELERTIVSLDEISQARVHLVIPEKHLFSEESNVPKASVTIHLKSSLNLKQVRSIQQLISASVPHLTLKNVVVVDQSGNTLSASSAESNANHFSTKKTMELYLTNKILHLLAKIFSEQQVSVKVDVLLNYDEVQRELVKPQTQGLISHEKVVHHTVHGKTAKDKTKEDSTSEKSYQLGSEKELFKRAHGTIERLSVSVLVPKTTSAQSLEQIQRIVKNSVGFDEQRGDQISVEALIAAPTPHFPVKVAAKPTTITLAENNHLYIYCFALILCIGSTSILFLKQQKTKRRQHLLLELTQWLDQHD